MEMFSTFLCVSGVLISSGILRKFSEKPVDEDKQKLECLDRMQLPKAILSPCVQSQ